MSQNSFSAKFLRFIGIVLMSLTAAFTLLGGVGTVCVALNPTGWEGKFAAIAPLQWLWLLFVLVGIAAGVMGIRAVVLLVKGRKNAYRYTLIALFIGTTINLIHVFASRASRGASMPVDAVLYSNVLTLVIFLLFRLPPIWQGVDFTHGDAKSNQPAGGAAAILIGLLTLTIQYTMGSTHTWGGINYANAFQTTMIIVGVGSILLGVQLLMRARLPIPHTARQEHSLTA